ncbi:MAG: ABC transporter substrate-binding protein, partial [Candidatus Marinimicrobia bacterium]|nr:ABC transporter substrate-binding protein [Candidatus Neomarinimicrobiota bacterium]
MKTIHQVLFMALLLASSTLLAQKTYIIKMATVAPEGSSWMNEMRNFEKEIIELTNGQIKFRVY